MFASDDPDLRGGRGGDGGRRAPRSPPFFTRRILFFSFPSSLLALDDACLEASRACTAFYRRVAVEEGPEIVRPLGRGGRGGGAERRPAPPRRRRPAEDGGPSPASRPGPRPLGPDGEELRGRTGPRPRRHSRARAGFPTLVVLDLRFDIPDEELLPDRRPLGETAAGRRERRDRRDRQGLYILERLRRRAPDLPVVLTTAHEEIPFEDEARRLRADAFTYTVGEDETTGEGLVRLVRRVLAERDAPLSTGRFFWGRSAPMRELRRRIASLAPTPLPLLVTGPTGSGKNFLVREVIHPLSGRKGPLVSFDCATVPETLLQAALFGSVRGSYTGSVADRPGVFEAAAGGTLFLDEIENLSAGRAEVAPDGAERRRDPARRRHGLRPSHGADRRGVERGPRKKRRRRELPGRPSHAPEPRARARAPAARRADARTSRTSRTTSRPRSSRTRATAPRSRRRCAPPAAPEPEQDDVFELARGDEELARSRAPVVFSLPRKGWAAIARHPWPGNVRQFGMVLADLLAATLYGRAAAARDRAGRVVFAVENRLLFDLLAEARQEEAHRPGRGRPDAPAPEGRRTSRTSAASSSAPPSASSSTSAHGDFARMAERMTGSAADERAVRLRFNKLGLSARREG